MFAAIRQSAIAVAAFSECCDCAKLVQERAAAGIRVPAGTPPEFAVSCIPQAPAAYALNRHFFSVLFQSVFQVLELKPEPRQLLGALNYLFRIWVTAADNLLDAEDKPTLDIRLPGSSRVMLQVVAVMAADRVWADLLSEAVRDGVLTPAQARTLLLDSLNALLPSAAQEASEEGGIRERPTPEYVLNTIHRLKTGMLFNLPFTGIEACAAPASESKIAACRDALMAFGLGCQLLDDIRDLARDAQQHRHNYVLSAIVHQHPQYEFALATITSAGDPDAPVFQCFPAVVTPTACLARELMTNGLQAFIAAGFDLPESAVAAVVADMFAVLGVAEAFPDAG